MSAVPNQLPFGFRPEAAQASPQPPGPSGPLTPTNPQGTQPFGISAAAPAGGSPDKQGFGPGFTPPPPDLSDAPGLQWGETVGMEPGYQETWGPGIGLSSRHAERWHQYTMDQIARPGAQEYIDALFAAGYTAFDIGQQLFGQAFEAGLDLSKFAENRAQVDPFLASQTVNNIMAMSGGQPVALQDAGVDALTAVTLDLNGDGFIDQAEAGTWNAMVDNAMGPGVGTADVGGSAGVDGGGGGGMSQADFQTQMSQFQVTADTRRQDDFNRMMTVLLGMMGGREEDEPYSLLYNPIGGA